MPNYTKITREDVAGGMTVRTTVEVSKFMGLLELSGVLIALSPCLDSIGPAPIPKAQKKEKIDE